VRFCAHKRNNCADEHGDGDHIESIVHEEKGRQRGKGRGKKGRDVCQRQGKLELWGKQKSQELYFEVGWEVRPVLYACTMAVRHPFQVRGTEYFLLYL
jgi:hypothetical protein